MRKPKRIVLGVGYLCFHINGREVSLVRMSAEGKRLGMFLPEPIELRRPKKEKDHRNVRLVAEVLDEEAGR